MQYLDFKGNTDQKAYQLTKYSLLVLLCLCIWFLPATHDICQSLDEKIFRTLNNSTKYPRIWGLWWAYLSHKYETWLNLFLLIGINIFAVIKQPYFRRAKALSNFIYFWLFFQIILIMTNFVSDDLLAIHRICPSIALKDVVNLSDFYEIPNLKVTSSDCFPAGHALALVFWARFSMQFSKPWLQKIILAIALILTLPRLFSGAHWTSDVIFTIFYSLLWYEIAVAIPFYPYAIKKLEKLCKFVEPRRPTQKPSPKSTIGAI